jgi:NADH-quinone oxidoreductase subunit M
MQSSYLLTVLTFLPLAGIAALLLLRRDDHEWIRRIALLITAVEFLLSLALLYRFQPGLAVYQFEELRSWIPQPPIYYHLGVDGISLFLVLLTTFLMPLSILVSWKSITSGVRGFYATLLALETGLVGVFVSLDLFLFFLFWEAMLLPMYLLIGIWGHERRVYASIKFVLYTMLGSILMLVGIIWLYQLSGTFDLPRIQSLLTSGAWSCRLVPSYFFLRHFFWHLQSRCRFSRCTRGCPTRTRRLQRPVR